MLERAADLDPFDGLAWTYLSMTYAGAGQLGATKRAAERALSLDPTNPYAAFWKAAASLLGGCPADALAVADWNASRAHELFGLAVAAMAYWSLGDERRSRDALDALATQSGAVMPYQVAEAYAWRGANDDAFAWLERARASRDAGLVLVTRDPFLQRLRGDARFAALLRNMNLRD
jgi:tetratricopeptide (TPR) repeat protein